VRLGFIGVRVAVLILMVELLVFFDVFYCTRVLYEGACSRVFVCACC